MIDRLKAAVAGAKFDPLPIVEYEYGVDDQTNPYGQQIAVPDSGNIESDPFNCNAVRIQVTVDCYYTIGAAAEADESDGGITDILFAGIPYHEVVDPTEIISLKSVDGSTGRAFVRPVMDVETEAEVVE